MYTTAKYMNTLVIKKRKLDIIKKRTLTHHFWRYTFYQTKPQVPSISPVISPGGVNVLSVKICNQLVKILHFKID